MGILLFLKIFLAVHGAELTVELSNFPNDKGEVLVFLFAEDSKEGFPKANPTTLKKTEKIRQGKAQVLFKDLKVGVYAISAIHDENLNQKMDQFLGFGPPVEAVGASNNPRGMPKFEEAKFDLKEGANLSQIKMVSVF